jgi:hypothetical protein
MNTTTPLARLMRLAFHLMIASAAALVLWTAWTGYLLATGQIRPTPTRAATAAEAIPERHAAPVCDCHHAHRDELQVRAAEPMPAT